MYFKNAMLAMLSYSAIFLFSSANASEISTAMGQGADAYIRGGPSADLNFGSESVITIKNAGKSSMHVARKTYLRFDISTFRELIGEAALHLIFQARAPQELDNTIQVYGLNEAINGNWEENDITWNNAPGNNISSSGNILASAPLLGSFTVAQGTDDGAEFIFTSDNFLEFISNTQGETITLILSSELALDDVISFYSKENTGGKTAPTLSLIAAPDPDPCDTVSVTPNFDIHVPSLNYRSLSGTLNLWADFEFYGRNDKGELLWRLKEYGKNLGSSDACFTETPVEVAPNLEIEILSLDYQLLTGTQNLWASLEYFGYSINGELLWKLKDYGINPK